MSRVVINRKLCQRICAIRDQIQEARQMILDHEPFLTTFERLHPDAPRVQYVLETLDDLQAYWYPGGFIGCGEEEDTEGEEQLY